MPAGQYFAAHELIMMTFDEAIVNNKQSAARLAYHYDYLILSRQAASSASWQFPVILSLSAIARTRAAHTATL